MRIKTVLQKKNETKISCRYNRSAFVQSTNISGLRETFTRGMVSVSHCIVIIFIFRASSVVVHLNFTNTHHRLILSMVTIWTSFLYCYFRAFIEIHRFGCVVLVHISLSLSAISLSRPPPLR